MVAPKYSEEFAYQLVVEGALEIDPDGCIWRVARCALRVARCALRVARRRWNRWKETIEILPCARHRAEAMDRAYFQVHVMIDGRKASAAAHRLVWRHFNGRIPDGMTINHKDGNKINNEPSNLELATHAEQRRHAIDILGHKPKPRARMLTVNGECLSIVQWSERTSVARATILARLRRGWSPEKSVLNDHRVVLNARQTA
jgi:hypothetical protein